MYSCRTPCFISSRDHSKKYTNNVKQMLGTIKTTGITIWIVVNKYCIYTMLKTAF